MILVPLTTDPNQSLSIRLGGRLYTLRLHTVGSVMSMDIVRTGEVVLSGQRLMPNYRVIPYEYLEEGDGNFVLTTREGEYPFYTQFGITQFLFYASNSELEGFRAAD